MTKITKHAAMIMADHKLA